MKKLFDAADIFMGRCKWQDMALLKLCLCAIGVMIGLSVPPKHRKPFLLIAPIVFAITYIPLMTKFLKAVKETGVMEE